MVDYTERVLAVDWSRYESAGGPVLAAYEVPGHLLELTHSNPARARNAASGLKHSLCHQGVFVDSAALPALPFVLEVLESTDDIKVARLLLELLGGFAYCSRSVPGPNRDWPEREWVVTLREELTRQCGAIARWATHADQDARAEAQNILRGLETA